MQSTKDGPLSSSTGLLTQGVPGVPQDPFAPPPGPHAHSPDSLKPTENPLGTLDFGLRCGRYDIAWRRASRIYLWLWLALLALL